MSNANNINIYSAYAFQVNPHPHPQNWPPQRSLLQKVRYSRSYMPLPIYLALPLLKYFPIAAPAQILSYRCPCPNTLLLLPDTGSHVLMSKAFSSLTIIPQSKRRSQLSITKILQSPTSASSRSPRNPRQPR